MSDFQNGFGYGVTLAFAAIAVWMIVMPKRYVQRLEYATFQCARNVAALRGVLHRMLGGAAEGGLIPQARIDSAIERRYDAQSERGARALGGVVLACTLAALYPPAFVPAMSCAAIAIALFVVRLENRRPANPLRRAATLVPRRTFDAALTLAIAVAAIVIGADLFAVLNTRLAHHDDLLAAGLAGLLNLVLALRLARRPASLNADDVAVDAFVDDQFRVTRAAYLLALALFPLFVAIMRGAIAGDSGIVLRTVDEAGFALVVIAWFAAAMRGSRSLA